MPMFVRKFFTWISQVVKKNNQIDFEIAEKLAKLEEAGTNSNINTQNTLLKDKKGSEHLKWLVREEYKQVSSRDLYENLSDDEKLRFLRACQHYSRDTELHWLIEVYSNGQQYKTLTQAETKQHLICGRLSLTALLGFKNMLGQNAIRYVQETLKDNS